jgi:hypothetical protein
MGQATREIDIQKEQYRYDAFISYAHEDKPTIAWLHQLLTTFCGAREKSATYFHGSGKPACRWRLIE